MHRKNAQIGTSSFGKDNCIKLMAFQLLTDFINRFKDSLFPLFQSVNQTADSERSSIVYEFGINGLLMAFHKWYEFENRMPIDDLLKLLQSIIGTGIPDTLKSL